MAGGGVPGPVYAVKLGGGSSCMVKGGNIGGFGGGWLEQPTSSWAGLFLGVPSCPKQPGAH